MGTCPGYAATGQSVIQAQALEPPCPNKNSIGTALTGSSLIRFYCVSKTLTPIAVSVAATASAVAATISTATTPTVITAIAAATTIAAIAATATTAAAVSASSAKASPRGTGILVLFGRHIEVRLDFLDSFLGFSNLTVLAYVQS